ncbi:hypothetical protein ABD07_07550 [Nitrosomonas oligotropha]|nr:hypothetical protein [Nitrosomonas oligotropha]
MNAVTKIVQRLLVLLIKAPVPREQKKANHLLQMVVILNVVQIHQIDTQLPNLPDQATNTLVHQMVGLVNNFIKHSYGDNHAYIYC